MIWKVRETHLHAIDVQNRRVRASRVEIEGHLAGPWREKLPAVA